MTLHPQARAALAGPAGPPLTRDRLADLRRSMRDSAAAETGPGVGVAVVRDVDAHGVPCRLYDPRAAGGAPVALYLHGGGWAMGSLDTADAACRRLADRSGCAVLSVEYRLAPEHPYPAGIDDAERALAWLRGPGAAEHGLDAARVAVAGDSAGAHLAAVLARRARDAGAPLAFQVLVYPVIDPSLAYPEALAGTGLDRAEMAFYWDAYAPAGVDRSHPDLSPLRAALAGLPPALVLTAEYDVLRDEGEAYAAALQEAGVPTVTVRYQGMIHGFFRKLARFDAAGIAVDQVAAALRAALDG